MTPYEELAALAEVELELVSAGSLDALPPLREERRALFSSLPDRPPASAEPALKRAAMLQDQVTALLEERLQEAGSVLRRVARGREAMHGYAPHPSPSKLVDRSG